MTAKTRLVSVALSCCLGIGTITHADDTVPPSLTILQSWVEKVGTVNHFKFLVIPKDNVGIDKIEWRAALGTTTALADNAPWTTYAQWTLANQTKIIDLPFTGTSNVIELRAKDAAGNASVPQQRSFQSPFTVLPAPINLEPRFSLAGNLAKSAGAANTDCKGLFVADVDGDFLDDVIEVDNVTGDITVRMETYQNSDTDTFSTLVKAPVIVAHLTPGSIEDSAIWYSASNSRRNLLVVAGHQLHLYLNTSAYDPTTQATIPAFEETFVDMTNSGLSSIEHVAAADFDGDGYMDAVIVGTGDDGHGGSLVKAEVIMGSDQGLSNIFNTVPGPANGSAGRIAIDELTGDGKLDVAMVDTANTQVVVFKGNGDGTLNGSDSTDASKLPLTIATANKADAIATGDIAGRGHSDIVVTEGALVLQSDSLTHYTQSWQYLAYDPTSASGYTAQPAEVLAADPTGAISTVTSDIKIQDFTANGYPQVAITSTFEHGVRLFRPMVPLDNQNHSGAYFEPATPNLIAVSTATSTPQRLATGLFGGGIFASTGKPDLIVAEGNDPNTVSWFYNNYTSVPSATGTSLLGSLDVPNYFGHPQTGTPGVNGTLTYTAFPNDSLNYTLSYVNNTGAAITGATVSCTLPTTVAQVFASGNGKVVKTASTWTLTWALASIPAHSAGVVTFGGEVGTSVSGTMIAPTATFKKGAIILGSCAFPTTTVQEALLFSVKPASSSDALGATTHKDETLTYTIKVSNTSSNTLMPVKFSMPAFPAGLKFAHVDAGSSPVIHGPAGKETGCDWTIASMAQNAVVTTTITFTVTGAENTSITESTAVVTHGTSKVTAAAVTTRVLPALGIVLSADNATARPGDMVQYTATIHNYSSTAASNLEFVDQVPPGMRLVNLYLQTGDSSSDYAGAVYPLDNSITATTSPGYDGVNRVMIWKFASLPSNAERSVKFDCQVLLDDPFYALGSNTTPNAVTNAVYNAVGTFGTVKSFAGVPTVGVATASKTTATAAQLLAATLTPVVSTLSAINPLPLPKLTLKKFVSDPDGVLSVGSDLHFTVINDPAISNDGTFHYALAVHNGSGAGTATGVVVHEFIPTGVTFQGFIARDGTNVSSYAGFHFYNAAGVEITNVTGATTPLVKSFTMPVGDLAANATVLITYQVATTLAAGGVIVSNSAALSGKSGLYTFDAPAGYCLTSSNMNFPTVGSPKQLTVNVIAPAAFNFPAGILHSAPKVKDVTGTSGIAIPVEVIGADGLDLSNIKMVVTIPKGYLVKPTLVLVAGDSTPIPGSTNVRVASTGITTLTFPIGNNRHATASFDVSLDPANLKVIEDATGHLKAPLSIKPTLTGSYGRSATATAFAHDAHILTDTATPKPIAPSSTQGAQEFVLANNAAIFVGRYAPATVRRGSNLTYTIFTGNLSDAQLSGGTISMNIPAGTTFVSASHYGYDIYAAASATGDAGFPSSSSPFGKGALAAGKVTWNIGLVDPGEGGAVTLTVNVPANYSGGRIDDNTCTFQLDNGNGKTPGPLGVVVLNGNDPSQTASTTQSAFEGVGATYTDAVRAAMELRDFTINNQSYNVTCGGGDAMHLQNDGILIPLKSASNLYNRVMLIGPKAVITGTDRNIMVDDGNMRVVVGPGEAATAATAIDVKPLLANYPGATAFAAPNSILSALNGGALVAQGGGNLVAAGGGNLVANGTANLVAAGGGNLVAAGGGNFASIPSALILLPASDFMGSDAVGGHLVAAGGGNLIATGGGNLVAAGGGNLIATGGGNLSAGLISNDGGGLVAKTVDSLIGQDGAGLQVTGANNLFSSSTGNLLSGALTDH